VLQPSRKHLRQQRHLLLLVLLYYMLSTTTTTVTELSRGNGERQLGSQKSPVTRPLNNRRAKSQESLMRKNPRVRQRRRHRSKTPSNSLLLLLLLHLQFTKVSTTQIFRNLTILLLAPKPHTTVVDTAIHAHYIAHHDYHHHHGGDDDDCTQQQQQQPCPVS